MTLPGNQLKIEKGWEDCYKELVPSLGTEYFACFSFGIFDEMFSNQNWKTSEKPLKTRLHVPYSAD